MNISCKRLAQSKIECTVTVSEDARAKAEQNALKMLSQNIELPGFRKGSAPADLVRSKIDPEDLLSETVRALFPDAVRKAVEQEKINPILRPNVAITTISPLVFTLVFVERPAVKLPKDSTLKVKGDAMKEVVDTDVDQFLKTLLSHDRTEIIVDREAKEGDLIRASLKTVDAKGNDVKSLTRPQVQLILGAEDTVPELDKEIRGMKKGDSKTVVVNLPKTYMEKDLAGQAVKSTVTVQEVASLTYPEITADYLKNKLKIDKSPAEFKTEVKDMLKQRREQEHNRKLEDLFFNNVEKNVTIDMPGELIDAEAYEILADFEHRLKSQEMTLEKWLEQSKRTMEQVLEEMRGIAKSRLTLRFGLRALIDEKKIEATDADVTTFARDMHPAHDGHNHPESDYLPGGAVFDQAKWELQLKKLVEMFTK